MLAFQYAELFGIDRSAEFNATPQETGHAKKFWSEFVEYRTDRQPGEEYELVQHWGEDLGLHHYFELVDEKAFRSEQRDLLAHQVANIEADPLNRFSNDPERAEQMRNFQGSAAALGLNMAVVMYMVDALQYFATRNNVQIKETAFEIAMLGTQGIRPDAKDYKLHHVPGKTFTGYHLLAYYYVSWKLAIPEMLAQLQLPYDSEYQMAVELDAARK